MLLSTMRASGGAKRCPPRNRRRKAEGDGASKASHRVVTEQEAAAEGRGEVAANSL
jgi:hypothetical protein